MDPKSIPKTDIMGARRNISDDGRGFSHLSHTSNKSNELFGQIVVHFYLKITFWKKMCLKFAPIPFNYVLDPSLMYQNVHFIFTVKLFVRTAYLRKV